MAPSLQARTPDNVEGAKQTACPRHQGRPSAARSGDWRSGSPA